MDPKVSLIGFTKNGEHCPAIPGVPCTSLYPRAKGTSGICLLSPAAGSWGHLGTGLPCLTFLQTLDLLGLGVGQREAPPPAANVHSAQGEACVREGGAHVICVAAAPQFPPSQMRCWLIMLESFLMVATKFPLIYYVYVHTRV